MKGIIYKATSNYDGRVYIGQTIASLRHRRGEHEKDSKSENDWNYFHTALFQQNYDFEWEVIDTFVGDADFVHHALNVAEEYHILKHRSAEEKYGYNSTYGGYSSDKYAHHYKVRRGGSGAPKSFWQYDLDGNFIREWSSLREIADAFNRPKMEARKLSGQWRGFQWRPKVGECHPTNIGKYEMARKPTVGIAMYGTDGKLIKTFAKRIDAEKEYGRGITVREDFSKVVVLPYRLRNSRVFFRILVGCDVPDTINVTITMPRPKSTGVQPERIKCAQYDTDGNFVAKYDSLTEAQRGSGYSRTAIKDICLLREPIAITAKMKYLWRYVENEPRPRIDIIPYVPKEKPEPKMEHRVLQYSLDGEYIATHANALKASIESGDAYTTIKRLCLGVIPMKSPKFQWRDYTENFPQNIGRIILKPKKGDMAKPKGKWGGYRPRKKTATPGQQTLF